jgi:hypothetical protein
MASLETQVEGKRKPTCMSSNSEAAEAQTLVLIAISMRHRNARVAHP